MKKSQDIEYTGTLPIVLDTKSGYLKSYKIYGNTGGVGTQTDDGYKIPITSQVNMWCSELETKVNPSAPEKNYIHITVTRDLPTESTIQETGIIYYSEADANTLTSLTIDTPGAASKHGTILTPSDSYGTNLEDVGNGIAFVGYVVIDGVYYYSKVYYYTWDYVKEHEPISFPDPTPVTTDIYIGDELLGKNEYVDSLSGKIVRIRDVRSELGFSITEPYPTVNASGVGRVTVVKSISWETELTIVETGLIYVTNISNTDDLILENVGVHGIKQVTTDEHRREHTLNLTDPDGNGARIVGYAIVTDGTHETTLYSEEAKATYQQLVDEPGQSHLYPGPDDVGGIPDPQNPPVPLPQISTFDGSTTIVYEGTPAPSNVVLGNSIWVDVPYKLYTDSIVDTSTFPATFKGDGSSISDWTITGNCYQASTPTPGNPIAVEECGERTANLFDSDTVYSAYKQADGTYQGTVNNFYALHPTPFTASDIGKTFTFSIKVNATTSGNVRASANVGGASISGNNLSAPGTTNVTFTVASTNDYLYLGYGSGGGNQINISEIMLTEGSTPPSSYIPYGYKLPLTSASQNVDIYLGESQTTRRIRKLVLTGEEGLTWYRSATRNYSWYIFPNTIGTIANTPFYCSHGETVTNVSDYEYGKVYCDNTCNLGIFDSSIDSITKLNNYFAQQYANGTPVTIWYVLATEETGILNEPLRKIGDYADTIDSTQTTVQIPVSGETTIDYDGTLAPSQFELSVYGWVDMPYQMRSNNQWIDAVEQKRVNGEWV